MHSRLSLRSPDFSPCRAWRDSRLRSSRPDPHLRTGMPQQLRPKILCLFDHADYNKGLSSSENISRYLIASFKGDFTALP